jgi:hypothetical protein
VVQGSKPERTTPETARPICPEVRDQDVREHLCSARRSGPSTPR